MLLCQYWTWCSNKKHVEEGMTIELKDLKVWCDHTNIELDVAIRNMKKGGYDHRVGRS